MGVMLHTFRRSPNTCMTHLMHALNESMRLKLGIAKNKKITFNKNWVIFTAGIWRVPIPASLSSFSVLQLFDPHTYVKWSRSEERTSVCQYKHTIQTTRNNTVLKNC